MRTWWQPLIHLNAILNLNESLWLFICIVRAPTAATSVLFSSYLRARLYLGAGRGGVRRSEAWCEALSNSCCWQTLFCEASPKYVSAAGPAKGSAYGSISFKAGAGPD